MADRSACAGAAANADHPMARCDRSEHLGTQYLHASTRAWRNTVTCWPERKALGFADSGCYVLVARATIFPMDSRVRAAASQLHIFGSSPGRSLGHQRHCVPVRLSNAGRSSQFGRAWSAPAAASSVPILGRIGASQVGLAARARQRGAPRSSGLRPHVGHACRRPGRPDFPAAGFNGSVACKARPILGSAPRAARGSGPGRVGRRCAARSFADSVPDRHWDWRENIRRVATCAAPASTG